MAATSAVLGLLSIAAPDLMLDGLTGAVGGGASPLDVPLVRLAGATMGISACTEGSLANAAWNGTLGSSPGRFLSLAVLIKSAIYLLALALARDAWTPALLLLYPSTVLVSIALNAYALAASGSTQGSSSSSEGSSSSSSSFGGRSSVAVPIAPTQYESFVGGLYGLNALLFLAEAVACFMPEAVFYGAVSPVSQLLKYTCAPGYFICAAACYALKDALATGAWRTFAFLGIVLGLSLSDSCCGAVLAASLLSGTAAAGTASWLRIARLVVLSCTTVLAARGLRRGGPFR